MATSPKRDAKRLTGLGLGAELAAALVGFALIGLWIDRHYGTGPWALLISLAVGTIGGLYNFIRSSLRIMRPPPTSVTKPATARQKLTSEVSEDSRED